MPQLLLQGFPDGATRIGPNRPAGAWQFCWWIPFLSITWKFCRSYPMVFSRPRRAAGLIVIVIRSSPAVGLIFGRLLMNAIRGGPADQARQHRDVGREHRNRYRDRTPCEAITKTKHGQPPEETIPIPISIAIWRERRLSAWACRGTSERHEIGQPRPAPHNTEEKRETFPNPAPLRTPIRLRLRGPEGADDRHQQNCYAP